MDQFTSSHRQFIRVDHYCPDKRRLNSKRNQTREQGTYHNQLFFEAKYKCREKKPTKENFKQVSIKFYRLHLFKDICQRRFNVFDEDKFSVNNER